MPVLPGSLSLTVIPDGSPIIAADHRNNYGNVQTAVNGLIAILDNGNGIDGDPLVWDATLSKWSAASRLAAGRPRPPRIVTSTMAAGPPASPLDGDIWIATAVDANGTRWAFQYNAGSASAYKWEFIGGATQLGDIETAEATASAAMADLATVGPTFTLARAGDYLFGWGAEAANSVIGNASGIGLMINGVEIARSFPVATAATAYFQAAFRQYMVAGVVAGANARLRYLASGGTSTFQRRTLAILPVRIS